MTAWPAGVPLDPDRTLAQSWAERELARREYLNARPGLLERALTWLGDKLNTLSFGGGAAPGLGLLVAALLVAAVAGYLIYRAGGLRRTVRRPSEGVLASTLSTAAEHRDAADRHAAAGQWDLAVVERFRAIARELEERTVLSPQPGRTALEVAREGGAAVPDAASGLLIAARYFDDVSYGHLQVGQSADLMLRRLDDRLRMAPAR